MIFLLLADVTVRSHRSNKARSDASVLTLLVTMHNQLFTTPEPRRRSAEWTSFAKQDRTDFGKRLSGDRHMQIFIDESGTFVTHPDGSAIGAVGALVVTENQLELVERMYAQLRPLLPKERGEVKGRLLGEADVGRVARLCQRSGLIYEVTAIDLPPNADEVIERHRARQCEGLTRKLTKDHQPDLVAAVHALRRQLEELPLQLAA